MNDLTHIKCVPCEVGAPTLTDAEIADFSKVVTGWEVIDANTKIQKNFVFKDFLASVDFVNKIANLAESEGHHPDILIHDYKEVRIILWTHKIGGLHKNDFVLAAKIDKL